MKALYKAIDRSIENNKKLRELLEKSRSSLETTKAFLKEKKESEKEENGVI